MQQRLHCPRHDEKTPSVVIYEDYAFCYGGCGRIPLEELGRDIQGRPKPPPENLDERLAYIAGLPRASVRGLQLPVDGDSFYIPWPSANYYKQRKLLPGEGPKYLCPRGHAKPLFIPRQIESDTLAIVEGELNALSLSSIEPPFSVCSPGGVGDFNEKILAKCNTFFFTHSRFVLILDKDGPGLEAAIRMKGLLLQHTPYVAVHLMKDDYNELLQSGRLKEETKNWNDWV